MDGDAVDSSAALDVVGDAGDAGDLLPVAKVIRVDINAVTFVPDGELLDLRLILLVGHIRRLCLGYIAYQGKHQ